MAHVCTIWHTWHLLAHNGARIRRNTAARGVSFRLAADARRAQGPIAGAAALARRGSAARWCQPAAAIARSISAMWSKPRVSSTSSTAVMPGSVRAASRSWCTCSTFACSRATVASKRRERAGDVRDLHPHAHAAPRLHQAAVDDARQQVHVDVAARDDHHHALARERQLAAERARRAQRRPRPRRRSSPARAAAGSLRRSPPRRPARTRRGSACASASVRALTARAAMPSASVRARVDQHRRAALERARASRARARLRTP